MASATLLEISLPIVEPPAMAAVPTIGPSRRRRWPRALPTIPALLLLTIIAGCLRFTALARPTIWGDEAVTYGRVAGTYQDLLDQLYDSSFPPLHYELLWWLHEGMPYWGKVVPRSGGGPNEAASTWEPTDFIVPGGIPLTPFFMRLIPSIAGTLFIPAIYFLARQLFGPRVSLVSAFLACFSAYLMVYARDAKMYMPFWLMCVINAACLLWWLRVRRPLPWLLWVASGVAMIGFHASGFTMLAIEAIFFLTSPKLHWRKLTALMGLIFWPIALPAAYGAERLRRRYDLIDWIRWDRFITWPQRLWRNFRWPAVVFFAMGIAIILSTMFGPLGFYSGFNGVYNRAVENSDTAYDLRNFGIDWVARFNAGRRLPDYLLYTSSAYLTGIEWPRHFPAINADDAARVPPRTLRLLEFSTVAMLGLLAIGLVPWRRAFSPVRARLDRIQQDGRVAPAFCRRRLIWMSIWLTAVPWIAYTQSTSRPATILDGFAAIVLADAPRVEWPRATVIQSAPVDDSWGAAMKARWQILSRSIDQITSGFPAAWHTYASGFRAGNDSVIGITIALLLVAGSLSLVIWKRRYTGRGAMNVFAVTLSLILIGTALELLPNLIDSDVWMPRYLGVIVPAVLIASAVLITRQPTRWLTATTLGLFVIINLSQYCANIFGHGEPPTDRMAADLIAAQPKSIISRNAEVPTFRDYTGFGRPGVAEPGGSALFNSPGFYYLHLYSGWKDRGRQVREGMLDANFQTWRVTNAAAIEKDLERSPQITSFVVWSSLQPGEIDQTDPVAALLVGRFRRSSDQIWPVADHWTWIQRNPVRRRMYVKLPNPTTAPASP